MSNSRRKEAFIQIMPFFQYEEEISKTCNNYEHNSHKNCKAYM